MKIAAIVVTYNRKDLLRRCIDAIYAQTYRPSEVYIIDNASTDGTGEMLKQINFNDKVKVISFNYVKLDSNTGGAGGFCAGIKEAYKNSSNDAFWLMDDDGCPAKDCLENLVKYVGEYDYISPLVVYDGDCTQLAFPHDELKTVEQFLKIHGGEEIVKGLAFPFNGVIFTREVVNKIGFPKKEYFIWGDEINYELRARKSGFFPVTVINARHYHPKRKLVFIEKIFFGKKFNIPVINGDLRLYCFVRNYTHNCYLLESKYKAIIRMFLLVMIWSMSTNEKKTRRILRRAFIDGLKGDFSRHQQYMN